MNLFILLAEDNEFHAAALEAALRRMGHSVHRTGSRAEALDRLYYHAYDLVITDLRMPGVTSLEGGGHPRLPPRPPHHLLRGGRAPG